MDACFGCRSSAYFTHVIRSFVYQTSHRFSPLFLLYPPIIQTRLLPPVRMQGQLLFSHGTLESSSSFASIASHLIPSEEDHKDFENPPAIYRVLLNTKSTPPASFGKSGCIVHFIKFCSVRNKTLLTPVSMSISLFLLDNKLSIE